MRLGQAVIAVISRDQFGQDAALSVRFRDFDLLENELKIVFDQRNHNCPHNDVRRIAKRVRRPLNDTRRVFIEAWAPMRIVRTTMAIE
ncbi:hypothetical protein CHKEEEPN_3658 [Methylorubrum podarium]|nr:hypothetical protein CHKEEEPN_3658 [Methylorubrum podarium]